MFTLGLSNQIVKMVITNVIVSAYKKNSNNDNNINYNNNDNDDSDKKKQQQQTILIPK